MRYYLLMYAQEQGAAALPKEEMDRWIGEIMSWSEAMQEAGVLVRAEGLHPTSAAVTVRVQNGKKVTTHGPFAETKEQLGGFYLIEAADLDQAIAFASKIPAARYGCVEVRPIHKFD